MTSPPWPHCCGLQQCLYSQWHLPGGEGQRNWWHSFPISPCNHSSYHRKWRRQGPGVGSHDLMLLLIKASHWLLWAWDNSAPCPSLGVPCSAQAVSRVFLSLLPNPSPALLVWLILFHVYTVFFSLQLPQTSHPWHSHFYPSRPVDNHQTCHLIVQK